jgi:hypothetical protein
MPSFDDLSGDARVRARRHVVMSIWRHGEVTAAMLEGPVPLDEDDEFVADWATGKGLDFTPEGEIRSV